MAPDGSLIIADWYDVGVGGHQAGDQVRGRIYRVAPAGSKYSVPSQDYSTAKGAVKALQSPNLSTRFQAWSKLQAMGAQAIPALEELWNSNADSRMRARALWALVKIPGSLFKKYIDEGIHDKDPDLRITGLRAATGMNSDVVNVIKELSNDKEAQVKRACLIALHHLHSPESANLWANLASQYDGKDRWYLEALGIGADQQWDSFFSAWLTQVKDPLQTVATRDIVWRARTEKALPYLAQLAVDNRVPLKERLRYFRAFDFNTGDQKSALLLEMIAGNGPADTAMNKLVLHHLDVAAVRKSTVAQNALKNVLLAVDGTPEYIELVTRYELRSENNRLLQLALENSTKSLGVNAARTLLQQGGHQLAWKVLNGPDTSQANKLIRAISRVGSTESIDIVQKIALSKSYPANMREIAAANLGRSGSGEDRVLELLRAKKVPADLIPPMVASVNNAWRKAIRDEATRFLPGAAPTAVAKAPSLESISALTANAAERLLFTGDHLLPDQFPASASTAPHRPTRCGTTCTPSSGSRGSPIRGASGHGWRFAGIARVEVTRATTPAARPRSRPRSPRILRCRCGSSPPASRGQPAGRTSGASTSGRPSCTPPGTATWCSTATDETVPDPAARLIADRPAVALAEHPHVLGQLGRGLDGEVESQHPDVDRHDLEAVGSGDEHAVSCRRSPRRRRRPG